MIRAQVLHLIVLIKVCTGAVCLNIVLILSKIRVFPNVKVSFYARLLKNIVVFKRNLLYCRDKCILVLLQFIDDLAQLPSGAFSSLLIR
jgi:hypothetical protein